MYWPGITDAIKDSISACKAYLTHSDRNQCEPYVSDPVTKPWSHLSLDNFEFCGQHFLLVLDISTKFFVVRPVPSLGTDATIQILTCIFSEHGFPLSIRCDRGRNFVSDLFHQYCQHLGISLSFSSAYHHSGNPAERAIRMVKGLMKHCNLAKQSWRLAMIEYLSTPLDGNTLSPSELNGCQFNSLLPNVSNFSSEHSETLVSHHDAQLQHDKRSHVLPELPVGSKVGYRNHIINKFDVDIISARDSRSYAIFMENGAHVSQNCIDLKQTDAPFEPKTQPFASSNVNHKHVHAPPTIPVPSNTNVKCDGKANLTEKGVKVSNTNDMYKTRSCHISNPATRLITQM